MILLPLAICLQKNKKQKNKRTFPIEKERMASYKNFLSKESHLLAFEHILGHNPIQGDMGQRPAAGKPIIPKMLDFASGSIVMLNQWKTCCGTEKDDKEGIVSKVAPGAF